MALRQMTTFSFTPNNDFQAAESLSRKRPRSDSAQVDVNVWPVNHPSLYFDDGNVVLQCEDTYFRVHRTLLSRNSPVFEEMFTACDGSESRRVHGCIFVVLEDSKDDLELLLNKIYSGFDIEESDFTTDTFPALAVLLRILVKYQISRPRRIIFDILRSRWPASLELHDAKQSALAAMHAAQGSAGAGSQVKIEPGASAQELVPQAATTVIHPGPVIALLRTCGYSAPDLLAPLFYELSTRIWQFGPPTTGYHFDALSKADIQRFVVGVNRLRSMHASEARCPHGTIHPICATALKTVWYGDAMMAILNNQTTLMCHTMDDWAAVISIFKRAGVPHPGAAPAAPAYPANLQSNAYTRHVPTVIDRNLMLSQCQPQLMLLPQGQQVAAAPVATWLCAQCNGAVLNSLEDSRKRIWDALPQLFDLV